MFLLRCSSSVFLRYSGLILVHTLPLLIGRRRSPSTVEDRPRCWSRLRTSYSSFLVPFLPPSLFRRPRYSPQFPVPRGLRSVNTLRLRHVYLVVYTPHTVHYSDFTSQSSPVPTSKVSLPVDECYLRFKSSPLFSQLGPVYVFPSSDTLCLQIPYSLSYLCPPPCLLPFSLPGQSPFLLLSPPTTTPSVPFPVNVSFHLHRLEQ